MGLGRCVTLMGRFGLARCWGRAGTAEEKGEVLELVWCRGQNQNRSGTEYGDNNVAGGCCLSGCCLSARIDGFQGPQSAHGRTPHKLLAPDYGLWCVPGVEMQHSERCRYSISQSSARVVDLRFGDVEGTCPEKKAMLRWGSSIALSYEHWYK